ncbi:hypothetical protein CHS0354_016564 [Potamilus streckersoni]|uniref:26S proteasome complex subunit SEM1 n=1 Tax=Potamilus streckersoni TaxID=2493646 RepID=A0AAE0WED0_9BIVA|nr:hypothetical protein CHS0354_016564 [Potamilus streckersoni]
MIVVIAERPQNIQRTSQSIKSYVPYKITKHMAEAQKQEESQKQEKKPDLGLLEEDDEFEEFPADDWEGEDEDKEDTNVWEDNWDDDNIEDDFSVQLRAELENQGKSMDQPEAMKT